jgi:hypothetical protein
MTREFGFRESTGIRRVRHDFDWKTKELTYLIEASQIRDPLIYGLLKSVKDQRVEFDLYPDLFYKIKFLAIISKQIFCS